ncbi:hypothetical protein KNP414_01748 [Paenibacillus mucilaginosus KNP414]|uniref:Uncharacterized protein n=1 Tax=Paenibacillus mucilaginosus (strain KNP414) TaxID=1036673 RepID=F8FQ90_PAEMK|nr:hypothetical protein KNP414_01748 [Paenibacillus mucilaginosus KNP414]
MSSNELIKKTYLMLILLPMSKLTVHATVVTDIVLIYE